jgi:hypothetical protein
VFGLAVVLVVAAVMASGTSSGLQPVELAAAKAGSAVAQPSVGTVTITDSGDWTLDEGPSNGYLESAHIEVHYRASETIRIPPCAVTAPGTTGCLATAADHSSPPTVLVGTPTVTASGSTSSTLRPDLPASVEGTPCDGQVQARPVSIGNNPNLINAPIQVHFALHEMWVYVAPPWVSESAATPPDVQPGAQCPPIGGHQILQQSFGPASDLSKVLPKTFTYRPPDPEIGPGETGSDTITITGSATPCSISAAAAVAASGSGTAHVASDGPVAVHLEPPDTPGNVDGFGLRIVATAANGCSPYRFLWKLVNVEHYPMKPNYIRVTPTVKKDGPAKQSTLHVKLECTVSPRVRLMQPDYWTRPCQSVITFLVKVTDKQGKKSLDKDSMVKFNWRPQCLTPEGVARIEDDKNRIVDDAIADARADGISEGGQHALTTVVEWESLGAALLAKGGLGAENEIGSLYWRWQLDQYWLQNKC